MTDHRSHPTDSGASPEPTSSSGEATPVALAGVPRGGKPDETAEAVRAACLAVTDFSWLSRGDAVLIKSAVNSAKAYPATTDPVAIAAMISLLLKKGAGRVIVADMSGVQYLRFSPNRLRGSTRELMHSCGVAAATKSAGGELHAFEENGWDDFDEERPAVGTHWTGPVTMPKILDQVDHIVLMPRCARHMNTGSSLGLKAAVGWWRHDSRLEYHHDADSLPEKTVEANTVASLRDKQRLIVTSATRVLTTCGPDCGYVHEPETGLIVASKSVVAHDMVSLAWLLENRRSTPPRERGVFRDPHRSRLIADLANRVVTFWLGGVVSAMTARRSQHRSLARIWDDLVLRSAFKILGGVPRVDLIDTKRSVPSAIRKRLRDAVAVQPQPPAP